MSADNGVYILKFPKGYKVTEAQGIDNLWWWNEEDPNSLDDSNIEDWEERTEINPKEAEEYFKDSKYYKTKKEAMERAMELYKEILDEVGICEYGIQYLGEVK